MGGNYFPRFTVSRPHVLLYLVKGLWCSLAFPKLFVFYFFFFLSCLFMMSWPFFFVSFFLTLLLFFILSND